MKLPDAQVLMQLLVLSLKSMSVGKEREREREGEKGREREGERERGRHLISRSDSFNNSAHFEDTQVSFSKIRT